MMVVQGYLFFQGMDVPFPVCSNAKRRKDLVEVCVFAILVYLKAWITAPVASNAPCNDLQLLQSLISYSTIQPMISKVASEKPANHLQYLSEDLIGLALLCPSGECNKKEVDGEG